MMISVVFDVDGLFVNTINHFMNVYNKVFKHFGKPEMSQKELFPMLTPDYSQILRDVGLGSKEAHDFQVAEWTNSLVRNDFGVGLYPGAQEFLDKVEMRYPFVFATASGREHIEIYKKHMKLKDSYKFITREDVPNPKPHPDQYIAAMEHLRSKPENTVVVDDIRHNLTTARKLGMKPIGNTWGFSTEEQFRREEIEFVRDYDHLLWRLDEIDSRQGRYY